MSGSSSTTSTRDMDGAVWHVPRATCHVRRATCHVRRATSRATCHVRRATCDVPRATCHVPRTLCLSVEPFRGQCGFVMRQQARIRSKFRTNRSFAAGIPLGVWESTVARDAPSTARGKGDEMKVMGLTNRWKQVAGATVGISALAFTFACNTTPQAMTALAQQPQGNQAGAPVMVNCEPQQRAVVRPAVLNGVAMSQVDCV